MKQKSIREVSDDETISTLNNMIRDFLSDKLSKKELRLAYKGYCLMRDM